MPKWVYFRRQACTSKILWITLSREVTVSGIARVIYPVWSTFVCFGVAFVLAFPMQACDFPLSSSDIREAYFVARQPNVADFLGKYMHALPELNVGKEFVTQVRLETPFFQVVDQVSRNPNYSAQDATKDFYEKPMTFYIYLEVCYQIEAPLPYAVEVAVMQNDKEIFPKTDERSGFFPATDPYARSPNLGEKITLAFDPVQFDSSTLTIRIDTPDDQHAKTEFDPRNIR
jgi:hypothetical protein